jgi:light-regulated signal transduction histidine kinase (bacteriophytochrome)
MVITIIVGLSILFQLIAALNAILLIRITRHRKAWLAIAAAIILMVIRRIMSFVALLSDGPTGPPGEITFEIIGLLTSILIALGLAFIAPLFLAIEESKEKLEHSLEQIESKTLLLESTNKELEAFAYTVSHDLGAPLNRINGYLKLLRESQAERLDDHGKEFVDRLADNTERMYRLINDLLKFSRLTRSELKVDKINLALLARKATADLQRENPDRKVEFMIADNVISNADPALMIIVLENLLGNAWKFTSKKDKALIEFGKEEKDGKTVYFVRDNGVGFNMAKVNRLFTPFQRLHSDVEFSGTGIGLATVQRIIHRHGGTIWAEAAPDAGATFYFTLG